jgi:hypothetical protein
MKLMVGSATNWTEAYGEVEDVQDYNLDKSMAAASLLDDVADFIAIAKRRGGPAKMILVLDPEQESRVIGAIRDLEQYDLERPGSRVSLIADIKLLIKRGKAAEKALAK